MAASIPVLRVLLRDAGGLSRRYHVTAGDESTMLKTARSQKSAVVTVVSADRSDDWNSTAASV